MMTKAEIELSIVKKIVRSALDKGFVIDVYDKMSVALRSSNNEQAVLNAMGLRHTSADHITFRKNDSTRVGSITFVYGNGQDVIADFTDNATMDSIINH